MTRDIRRRLRVGVLLALLLCAASPPAPPPARAQTAPRPPARFEPPDGTVFFGASSTLEAAAQIVHAADPARRPAVIALYDSINGRLNTPQVYYLPYDILAAHNLFPGARLMVGLQLPINPLDSRGRPVYPNAARELVRMGQGDYDATLRRAARFYRDLGGEIFLRPGYEFDGVWNNYDPAAYRAAFRRIVEIFRQERADNVAFVWNSFTPACETNPAAPPATRDDCIDKTPWYPGDTYVDWFSFNVWTRGFWPPDAPPNNPHADATRFMRFAAARGKPVSIDEASYVQTYDRGYTWEEWHGPFFRSVRASGVKMVQYINWNWKVYPRSWSWSEWANAKAAPPHPLRDPANTTVERRAELLRQELASPAYAVRGTSFYNPIALWIDPTRNVVESPAAPRTSAVDGQPVARENDEYAGLPGFGYEPGNALHYYGDGWRTYWGNPPGTTELSFTLTLPPGTGGYLDLEAHAFPESLGRSDALLPSVESHFAPRAPLDAPPDDRVGPSALTGWVPRVPPLPHTVSLGARPALRRITPEGPVKIRFTPEDAPGGRLVVRVTGPAGAQLRVEQIGIQTISPAAPPAPAALTVTAAATETLSLAWTPAPGAALYNIYRDGELIATTPDTRYTDSTLRPRRAARYEVSAWSATQGEGEISAPAAWAPPTTDIGGDGRGDLLWSRPDGILLAHLPGGPFVVELTGRGALPPGTRARLGDVDGDGRADLLTVIPDGRAAVWRSADAGLAPPAPVAGSPPGPVADVQLGDLDGDRRADIVWRLADGRLLAQPSADDGFAAARPLGSAPGEPAARLQLADMDGDRRADLVWLLADGRVHIQATTDAGLAAPAEVPPPGPGVREVRAGDVSGDGFADLVWLLADGRAFRQISVRGAPGPAAEIAPPEALGQAVQVALGDLSGDGRADLVWLGARGDLLAQESLGEQFGSPSPPPRTAADQPGARLCLPECAAASASFLPVLSR